MFPRPADPTPARARQRRRGGRHAPPGAFTGRPMLRRAEFDAKLKALTVEQANAAIRKFLKPAELSVFEAGDFAGAAKAATPAK